MIKAFELHNFGNISDASAKDHTVYTSLFMDISWNGCLNFQTL